MNRQDKIIQLELAGDFAGAEKRARKWTVDEPGEMWSWLMLAETLMFQNRMDESLEAMERPTGEDRHHPMFYRLVVLAGLRAKAFTAAHGGLFAARVAGLPEAILSDLETAVTKQGLLSLEGAFPDTENPDERWRTLLPPMWHRQKQAVRLSWGAVGDLVWVFHTDFLDLSIRFQRGEKATAWKLFPAAYEFVNERNAGASRLPLHRRKPQPQMLQCWSALRIAASLHLFGAFPDMSAPNTMRFNSQYEWLEVGSRHEGSYAVFNSTGLASGVQDILSRIPEPSVSLEGPDDRIAEAFPWLSHSLADDVMQRLGICTVAR